MMVMIMVEVKHKSPYSMTGEYNDGGNNYNRASFYDETLTIVTVQSYEAVPTNTFISSFLWDTNAIVTRVA